MEPLLGFVIVSSIFAIGDIVSIKSKSLLSVLFVASVFYLIGFWTIFPADINTIAQVQGVGAMMIPVLITHMGTLLNTRQLIDQWKTVIITIVALVGVGVLVYGVGGFIFGREVAIAASPPIAGGVVAGLIMSEAATAINRPELAVLATLLVVVQGFIGYPLASFCLTREARKILSGEIVTDNAVSQSAAAEEKARFKLPQLAEDLQTPFVLIAKVAVVAYLAVLLANAIPGTPIHPYVMTLIIGVIAGEIGLLETDILTKGNAFGFGILALMAIIMTNLNQATPEMLAGLLAPMFGCLILGAIGIAIGSSIVGKFLGLSIEMSTAIGVSALFGFPGTFILSHEAAKAATTSPEGRQKVLDHILPKMLVAGFMTVTIASVVMAGIFANWL
ncbi:MAG: hypothetical protein GX349_02510 [Firmicutes bacterium]|nr:hypothetical protein [Bacillota bacterium]